MSAFYVSMGLIYLLLVVAHLLMPSFVRPNLPFGVRVPEDRVGDPTIAAERRAYRIWVLLIGVVAVALVGAVVAVTGQQSLVAVGLALLVIVYWVVYYRAHLHLQAVKTREGWFAGQHQAVAVDTDLLTSPPALPWGWVLPAVAILVATVAIGVHQYPGLPATLVVHWSAGGTPTRFAPRSVASAFSGVFAQAGLTLILAALGAFLPRMRQDLDAARPTASALQARGFRRAMFLGLAVLTACVNLSLLVTSLAQWGVLASRSALLAYGPIALTLVGAVGVIAVAFRAGQGGFRLPVAGSTEPARPGVANRDDDRNWIGGALYFNRHDSSFLVNKRYGVGWTLNFGHPIAWVVVLALVALVVVPRL